MPGGRGMPEQSMSEQNDSENPDKETTDTPRPSEKELTREEKQKRLREKIKQGLNVDYLLPEKVSDYIKQKGLYQNG